MIPKELLKKIRHIEIRTTRLVNDLFGGEYLSVFKGQGMEFADVREYVPGDDIRTIDWNVTARSLHPFVKKFVEEREMTVFFAVDMSGSQQFGSAEKLKAEIAAEITALLSFAAVKNHDKVGLMIFTDGVEKFVPVKKGRMHVLRVIREILYYKPRQKGTNLVSALDYLNRVLRRTAVVFLISDFLDQGYEKTLKILSRRHDVIGIHLIDRLEKSLPKAGLLWLRDPETGMRKLIDSSSGRVRRFYENAMKNRQEAVAAMFKSLKIDRVEIPTDGDYVDPIIRLFKVRERRS